MQADGKVKLARDGVPVTAGYAYLDTGSVGPISSVYADALARCTGEDLARGRALAHRFERIEAAKARIRAEIAGLLGAEAEAIELTRSTTDGIGLLLDRFPFSRGEEIVTTALEFPACADVIGAAAHRRGLVVRVATPADDSADLGWLEACVTAKTRLIVCSGVAYATGQKLPLDGIAQLASTRGIATLVDGAQLVGAAALDMSRTPIDFLALPLQKWLLGPEGLGALCTRPGRAEAPEAGRAARAVHGWPVLEATAQHLVWMRETLGWRWIHERTRDLSLYARRALEDIEPGRLVTPEAHAGLVSLKFEHQASLAIAERLRAAGIVPRHRAELDLVRISTAFFNTEDEIDRCIDVVRARDGQRLIK